MKNILLITLFVCAAFFANAQFTTGEKQIAGQLGFGFNESNIGNGTSVSSNTFNVRFSPSFSRFKSPTLMTGAGLYYYYNRTHISIGNPLDDRIQPYHSFGVFMNRTKLEPLAKKFYFTYTGTASIGYQLSHPYYVSSGSATWQDSYGATVSCSIGLLYDLNSRFLLSFELSNVLALSYNRSIERGSLSNGTEYKTFSSSFGLSTNLAGFTLSNVVFGIRYRLKK
jgi:hypothetical protein